MTTTPSQRRLEETPTILSSQAEVWYLKPISYKGKELQIITQNFNGPCSFIAICNILILRENIRILPPTRTTVSYEFLSQLVAEYLLLHSPDVDISDALSIMPHTQKGLDLNPLFNSHTAFHPATDTAGAELKLFAHAGIHLVHGWLVSPGSDEAQALERESIRDYDSAVAFIAEADFLAGGAVVGGNESRVNLGREWTAEERRKIKNAITIRHFLESTQSQLTYHGLFNLASELPSGALVALFRNSHLAVLFKGGADGRSNNDLITFDETPVKSTSDQEFHDESNDIERRFGDMGIVGPTPGPQASPSAPPELESSVSPERPQEARPDSVSNGPVDHNLSQSPPTPAPPRVPQPRTHAARSSPTPPDAALYTLVTDQVFLQEPSVIWERIEDVDGAAGWFVDGAFLRSNPAGGDWAGRTAEETARAFQEAEYAAGRAGQGLDNGQSDLELAQQLQAEEEHYARRENEAYLREQERDNNQNRRAKAEQERIQQELERRRAAAEKKEKKKDCIIM